MQKESERLAKKAQEVGLLSDLKLHGSPLPISKCEYVRIKHGFIVSSDAPMQRCPEPTNRTS